MTKLRMAALMRPTHWTAAPPEKLSAVTAPPIGHAEPAGRARPHPFITLGSKKGADLRDVVGLGVLGGGPLDRRPGVVLRATHRIGEAGALARHVTLGGLGL